MTSQPSNAKSTWAFLAVLGLLVFAVILGTRRSEHTEAAPPSAVLRISPASGTQTVGGSIVVDVMLDSPSEGASVATVSVSPSSGLTYVSTSTSGSVFNQEIDPPTVTGASIVLSRARFDTGFQGTGGRVIRLTFTAAVVGAQTITINQNGSEILAYSDGTDILSSVQNGSFTVQAASTPSPPPPPGGDSGGGGGGGSGGGGGGGGSTGGGGGGGSGGGGGGGIGGGGVPVGRAIEAEAIQQIDLAQLCNLRDAVKSTEALPQAGNLLQEDVLTAGKKILTIFRDVPVDQWYARDIHFVLLAGIMSGYRAIDGRPLGLYGPADPVTYGQMAKLGAIFLPPRIVSATDTPKNESAIGDWSASYVRLAEDMGITIFASELPSVHAPATRGAVLEIFLQAAEIQMPEPLVTPFNDVHIDHRFARAIVAAAAKGIVRGDTDSAGNTIGTFRPDDSVNRAELPRIIANLLGEVCGRFAAPPPPAPIPQP